MASSRPLCSVSRSYRQLSSSADGRSVQFDLDGTERDRRERQEPMVPCCGLNRGRGSRASLLVSHRPIPTRHCITDIASRALEFTFRCFLCSRVRRLAILLIHRALFYSYSRDRRFFTARLLI